MNLYDVVALLEDLPAEGLKRGQVGWMIPPLQRPAQLATRSVSRRRTKTALALQNELNIRIR